MNGTKSLSSLAQNSGNSTEAEYAKFLEKLDMNINVFVGTLSKWFQNECRKAAKSGNAKFSCNVQVYNAHIFEVIVTNVRITEV
ncbi:MAG: hypothetical protein LBN42_02050, partial [Oscillospiraceae bacterium]|nr:hypothetical protein [Oscillospiraceae bacterium]